MNPLTAARTDRLATPAPPGPPLHVHHPAIDPAVPSALARLAATIGAGLAGPEARQWPPRFAAAVAVAPELDRAPLRFRLALLTDPALAVRAHASEAGRQAIDRMAGLLRHRLAGEAWDREEWATIEADPAFEEALAGGKEGEPAWGAMTTILLAILRPPAPQPHRFPALRDAAPDRLDDAAQALAADPRHLRMARALANQAAHRRGMPADEAYSNALLGLTDAARRFRPEDGVKFTSYAFRRIQGAIADAARSWRPGKRRNGIASPTSLEAPCGENEATLRDLLIDDLDDLDAHLMADRIEVLLAGLPRQHQIVLRLLYGWADSLAMRQTGDYLGLSRSRISQLHTEAIALIRARLAERGIHSPADL